MKTWTSADIHKSTLVPPLDVRTWKCYRSTALRDEGVNIIETGFLELGSEVGCRMAEVFDKIWILEKRSVPEIIQPCTSGLHDLIMEAAEFCMKVFRLASICQQEQHRKAWLAH